MTATDSTAETSNAGRRVDVHAAAEVGRQPDRSASCATSARTPTRSAPGWLWGWPFTAWVPTSRSVFDAGTLPESLLTLPGCELLVGPGGDSARTPTWL